ncbi:hypothetical protein B0H34DRAFT_748227 [Crassisporium funariophilum]|nr:hypothetical protein B0H34DRAFT_748227 [Crassisporium funariophilum]
MGLLKRLFSLGSKKNKKQRGQIVHNVPLPEQNWPGILATDEQEHEAAVGRLLRSSSARYVETSELDYATMPPLPHPINRVIQTPASSTISLASTSLSQRGTYNVTVHKRKRHASTEFPNANRDLEDQQKTPSHNRQSLMPKEDSRVLRLRSDPSVASLLDLYDEHGKLSSDAFSNSPPREERAQIHRNGSTLRQLLGAPSSLSSRNGNDSGEGDISWAERFLAETGSSSSQSSLNLHTPNTPQFYANQDISFVTDADLSGNAPDNPAISSMEVELSMITDISLDLDDLNKNNNPYRNSDPSTPQRASQVFGFLTRAKQSKPADDDERPLPELPSAFSSPSDENVSRDNMESHFSDNSSEFVFAPTRFSAIPIPLSYDTPRTSRPLFDLIEDTPRPTDRPLSRQLHSAFSDDSHDPHFTTTRAGPIYEEPKMTDNVPHNDQGAAKQNKIKVIMTGHTKVIVTAPTPSTDHNGPSRLPRGPRALPGKRSSGSVKRRRSALGELSNSTATSPTDPFTAIPARKRAQTHRRTSSARSTISISGNAYDPFSEFDYKSATMETVANTGQRKENQLCLSAKADIPATPLRSNTTGSRSLFRTVVHQGMFRPPAGMTPSPASTSEMSPVGRQIMTNVRQQRMNARELDREKSGKRFGNERTGLKI